MKISVEDKKAIIAQLQEHFPNCFSLEDPTPIKVGIHSDIRKLMPEVFAAGALRASLAYYTRQHEYLKACTTGASRRDVLGEPAGTVTEAEAESARERLAAREEWWMQEHERFKAERRAKRKAKKEKEITAAVVPEATTAPEKPVPQVVHNVHPANADKPKLSLFRKQEVAA